MMFLLDSECKNKKRLSESYAHLMGHAVVGQRNLIDVAWDYGSVDLDRGNPAGGAAWIFHHNLVSGGVIPEFDLEVSPCARDAGIDEQPRAFQAKSENPLNSALVHPAGRAGIPGPSTATDVRRFGINIGCDHVRFYLITVYPRPGACMIDRVQNRKEFSG